MTTQRAFHLEKVLSFKGQIELVTGLHIGSGNNEIHIGGTDSPVVKHPHTAEPYIPGSSIKGKMRSLLEWQAGLVPEGGEPCTFAQAQSGPKAEAARHILMLFGGAPPREDQDSLQALVAAVGPSRLAFWDCRLDPNWVQDKTGRDLQLTEAKMENSINRLTGVAIAPRTIERVPAGALFEFRLTLREHAEDPVGELHDLLARGFRLLQLTGLGGSGTRGYGKIAFRSLSLEGADWLPKIAGAAAVSA